MSIYTPSRRNLTPLQEHFSDCHTCNFIDMNDTHYFTTPLIGQVFPKLTYLPTHCYNVFLHIWLCVLWLYVHIVYCVYYSFFPVMDDIPLHAQESEEIEIDPAREAYYKEDPKKALRKFFDREGA